MAGSGIGSSPVRKSTSRGAAPQPPASASSAAVACWACDAPLCVVAAAVDLHVGQPLRELRREGAERRSGVVQVVLEQAHEREVAHPAVLVPLVCVEGGQDGLAGQLAAPDQIGDRRGVHVQVQAALALGEADLAHAVAEAGKLALQRVAPVLRRVLDVRQEARQRVDRVPARDRRVEGVGEHEDLAVVARGILGEVDGEGRPAGEPRVEELDGEVRRDPAVGEQVGPRRVERRLLVERHRRQQQREAQAQADTDQDGQVLGRHLLKARVGPGILVQHGLHDDRRESARASSRRRSDRRRGRGAP